MCAAHDVAPILEQALGVKEKDLMKDKKFVALVEKWGLDLEDGVAWEGIQKLSFAPKVKRGTREREGRIDTIDCASGAIRT